MGAAGTCDLSSLLSSCKLPLSSLLRSLRTSLSVQDIIPPAERARVVTDEALMMDIMMLSTGPEGQEVMQRPWEFIPGMRINSLEQATNDPQIHRQDVQILSDSAVDDRAANSSETQDHDFDRRRVFSGEAKGCRILMVNFMDVFVKRTPVHGAVRPVVPCILEHEENGNLVGDLPGARKGDGGAEAEVLA
jgi:hypothetical protein